MPETNFIDHVQVYCRSGKGGAGASHFHRDKLTAKGGPDGGDGGRGGHIIIRCNKQMWTLLHLRYRKHIHAGNGNAGAGTLKTGATGRDEILEVPPGTQVKSLDTGEFICELKEDGEQKILLEGGKGGLGNARFKNSIKQTPHYAQPGEPAKECGFIFELKLLADVGMVGLPNAGKSTLLSVVSAARPEIGNYAFTTLTPKLGVVDAGNNRSFVLADLPGIIEKAHEGKGLGLRFLRHIERSAVLLFVISAENLDVAEQYEMLLEELKAYSNDLLRRPRLIAISKTDLLDEEMKKAVEEQLPEIPYVFISAYNKTGLNELKSRLFELVHSLGEEAP